MLIENNNGVLQLEGPENRDSRPKTVTEGKGTSSWKIKGFSKDIRELAETTARNQQVKISDFLADAIVKYVESLEDQHDAMPVAEDAITGALKEYAARIEALENRLAVSEGPLVKSPNENITKLKSRIRVTNLVERPWLKNRY